MMDWIRDILARHNLGDEYSNQLALIVWDEVAGPQIARITRATLLSHGTLTVEVASSTIGQELSLLQQRYIDEINERMKEPVVTRIRFIPGRFPLPPAKIVIEDNGSDEGPVPDLAIQDQRLRDAFSSLYKTHRRRERALLKAGARRCTRCGVAFFGPTAICPGCQFDEIDEAGRKG